MQLPHFFLFLGILRKGLTPSKTTAEGQWEEKTFRDELKTDKHITVPFNKIRHVRTRKDLENFGGEFVRMASACKRDYWLIGLDTERSGCTIQIALIEGKKECYQVLQLYSDKYEHCTQHGLPQALIDILTHRKAVFIGKQVHGDVKKICEKLQIKEEQRKQIKFIELTKVYSWCRVLVKKPSRLKRFVQNPEDVVDYSLKLFLQFSDEKATIDKRGRNRWMVSWAEEPPLAKPGQDRSMLCGRKLRPENLVYAATDAKASLLTLTQTCDFLRITPSHFIQRLNSPNFLNEREFVELVEAYRGGCDFDGSMRAATEAANLRRVEGDLQQKVERLELKEFVMREGRRKFRTMKKKERGEPTRTPVYWTREAKEEEVEEKEFKEVDSQEEEAKRLDEFYRKEKEKYIASNRAKPPRPIEQWVETDPSVIAQEKLEEERENQWSMQVRDHKRRAAK
jgi:hypothetical protein